jgi:hypothetical protein
VSGLLADFFLSNSAASTQSTTSAAFNDEFGVLTYQHYTPHPNFKLGHSVHVFLHRTAALAAGIRLMTKFPIRAVVTPSPPARTLRDRQPGRALAECCTKRSGRPCSMP